jgi:hypothetical protein
MERDGQTQANKESRLKAQAGFTIGRHCLGTSPYSTYPFSFFLIVSLFIYTSEG